MTDGPDEVLIADDPPVRICTFNRPDRLNAFTATSYRAFDDALRAAAADDDVSVVMVTGAGRAFSSGVDLDDLGPGGAGPEAVGAAFDALVDALVEFPKPLVAAVHGPAVGFGATVLLHCDVVVVARDARLRFPFVRLATAPEAGSSVLLARAVGSQRAHELMLSARWVDAEEAVRIGLAARAGSFDETRAIAAEIGQASREALVHVKAALRADSADEIRAAVTREQAVARSLTARVPPSWAR